MKPGDEEEAWRQIVENFGETASVSDAAGDEVLPEERSSDLLESNDNDAPEQWSDRVTGLPQNPSWAHSADSYSADSYSADSWADEGHFVPPPPPPIPLAEPKRLLAWVGVFGAPVLVLLGIIFSIGAPDWFYALMLLWFVGGFGYLVATMSTDGRDPWDNGARL